LTFFYVYGDLISCLNKAGHVRAITLNPSRDGEAGCSKKNNGWGKMRFKQRLLISSVLGFCGGAFVCAGPAQAFKLYDGQDSGDNNLEVNLTTTLSYTGIVRTNNPSAVLTSVTNDNGSEGDLDHAHGLVSNQFEILPVLDIRDGNYGAHFSGEAYVNTVYLGTNQNNQPSTLNPISVAKNTDYTSATRNVEGENFRMLDAFVYGGVNFGADDAQSLRLKIGRQTLLWGQSLYLANNGISAGMAPFDVITSDNNPNAQTQQKIEPTGQVVVTYQPDQTFTFQGYYQFQWEPDYLEAVGGYFSSTDILDAGGQRLLFAPGFGALRAKNLSPPSQNGQFGGSMQLQLGNDDIGFYGLRYDAKAPTLYLNESNLTYQLVYPRDIWIEGAALSTTVGPANVAGEWSFRQHMPLTDQIGYVTAATPANANGNPLYPVGDTMAGQVSAIYVSPSLKFDPGGISVDGEIGFNHVLSYTENKATISAGRSSTAADMQGVITPTYYDVYPNLVLTFPIGLAYNLYGRSMIDATENHGTGSVNFGVTATYKVRWIASVTFNDYIGAPNPSLAGEPSIADRNYVLFNGQYSF
jgi:hypothetical protein